METWLCIFLKSVAYKLLESIPKWKYEFRYPYIYYSRFFVIFSFKCIFYLKTDWYLNLSDKVWLYNKMTTTNNKTGLYWICSIREIFHWKSYGGVLWSSCTLLGKIYKPAKFHLYNTITVSVKTFLPDNVINDKMVPPGWGKWLKIYVKRNNLNRISAQKLYLDKHFKKYPTNF